MKLLLRAAQTCLAATVLLVATPVLADLFVIINSSNSVEALTIDQINRVYLKKAKRFDNGVNAEPYALAEGSRQRGLFNLKVLQRDEQQLKYYWSRKMFSGGDRPPPVLGSEADVIAMVAEKPGGIAYVTAAPKDARVKVVLKIRD